MTVLLAEGAHAVGVIRPTPRRLRVICGVVNATTWLLTVAAVLVVLMAPGEILVWAIAAGLVALMVATLPRRPEPFDPRASVARTAAPTLFALLDRVAALLDTSSPDLVVIDAEELAAAGQGRGGQRAIVVGPTFTTLFDPAERVAVLAHELAHLGGNDPLEQRPAARALYALSCWHERFLPPTGEMALISAAGWYLVAPLAMVVRATCRGVAGLIVDASLEASIAAEYRADARAASIVGTHPQVSSLETLPDAPLLHRELVRWAMTHQRWDDPWATLQPAWHEGAAERRPRAAAAARAEREPHADDTHPPLGLRIAALEHTQAEPGQDWSDVDWPAIEREWSAARAAATSRLLVVLQDRAANGHLRRR